MTITTEQARDMIRRMDAAQDIDDRDDRDEELREIDRTLSDWLGGTPRDDLVATGYAIGPDYICALDDGSILAWGADRVIGRQLCIIDEPHDA